MESRKRMDYGFQGYQAPPLPRAMRSARGRGGGSRKKNDDENGMVFFELLATVAGNLLQQQEAQKAGTAGINLFENSKEAGNDLREEESSAEQALLELDKSRILPHGNDVQRQGFLSKGAKVEPDDQGSSDENAIASGPTHRKFISEELPIKEDPEMIIQSVSKSVSSINKLDCLGHSLLDNVKFLGMCIDTQAANERPMQGISLGEGEDKKGCCTDKVMFSTNACKGNFLTDQCLRSPGQVLPESAVELVKEAMGLVENGEGKGENEIDESKLGQWKRRRNGSENMEDELMHDAHSLPASSVVSGETPTSTDIKTPPLVSSGSSEDLPLCVGSKPRDSIINSPKKRVKVCKDDDDNSSGCTTPSRITKNLFKNTYFRGAKLRRSISKVRQAVSASSKKWKRSDIMSDTDRIVKRESPDSGEGFTRQRTVRSSPSKRKRLVDETFSPAADLHASNASATCLDSNGADGDLPVCASKIRRAKSSSVASSAAGSSKHSSKKTGDSHVKLSIKSFTIPELFIDMPESATVASLKRAVMEAAMNLLGDGLRVCVLLQGKKLPDESDTLYQLGISHGGKLDSVGFMLEPNPTPTSQTCSEDPLFLLSRAATQPSPRYPTVSTSAQTSATEVNKSVLKGRSNKINGMTSAEVAVTAAGRTQTDTNQYAKSEYEMITDSPMKAGSVPGALIVHPSIGTESAQGLALVPLNHRSQGSEVGKRRIRRPFTVNEVEALVQAVEKLGTGRWRDVKLRAFENAKHRTYVDLKDKWKTLVHTAKIAPHQRRGEPVPQELLDRVIHAHNYWTDEQAKQQAELCL